MAGATHRPDKGVPIPQGLVLEQPVRGADAFSFLSLLFLFAFNRSPAT